MAIAEQSKGRGSQSISRIFVNDEGDPTSRAQLDTNTVILKTMKDGKELRCNLADIFGGKLPAPCVGRAAAAFGVSTSLGNAGNSEIAAAAREAHGGAEDAETRRAALDAVNPEVGMSAMADRWASLQAGEWSAEREIGPSTSLLVEAVAAYRKAHGKDTTDADRERYRTLFKDKEEVKNHLKVAAFREIYEKMKMDRTLERLKAQGGTEADDTALLQ